MFPENVTVATYESAVEAERAIKKVKESGFELKNVSIAARDENRGEEIVVYYSGGSHVKCLGKTGEFWGSISGMLSGWAYVSTPDLGPVLVAGPLVEWIVAGLGNAAIFRGLSALGAGLYSIGLPQERIWALESALRSGRYLVLVHGSARDVAAARAVLSSVTSGPAVRLSSSSHM
jgi:Heat induced stress protein YflT domain